MKKGQKKPEEKVVRFLDELWKLKPGHSVYELDLNTDPFVVKEAALEIVFTWKSLLFFWLNRRVYQPKHKGTRWLHTTAKDLYTAKIKFKHMTSDLKNKQGKHVKVKGI